MATSSSIDPSFIEEVGEEYYSYPSHVCTPNPVTVKLSGKDKYKVWKTQMSCLLITHNMLGFINGKYVNPEGHEKRKVGDIEAWVRSDALVKSWILGSISEQAAMNVIDHFTSELSTADFTAKDVWDELHHIYDPAVVKQATEKETKLTSSMANVDGNTLEILLDCVERGRNCSNQILPTICVVASTYKVLNPGCFNPLAVSIGPLHKNDENLKESEVLKERYLHDLLQSINSPQEQTLKECVQKVNASIDQIRASYACMITFNDVDLAKMMVIDACFILQFCYKCYEEDEEYLPNDVQQICIVHDMILIENQIPFFVLQDLFDCTIVKFSSPSLSELLHHVLGTFINPFENHSLKDFSNTDLTHDHVLGYLHNCFPPVDDMPSKPTDGTEITTPKELAMKIKLLFECFSWCLGKPTLLVPTLFMSTDTEPIFRNLIAYEQSVPKVHKYFVQYANALHYLVRDQEDVGTLVELKVLVNRLSSNKEAADMISRISNTLLLDLGSNLELLQLTNYYHSSRFRNLRRLRHAYFSSPWSVIALVAGIVLFTLTVVQTIFTIKAT